MQAPTAPASHGPISSAGKRAIETVDARQAPIPLPRLKPGQRCFRSKSRGFALLIKNEQNVIVNGTVINTPGKIAQFEQGSGFFEGKVYDFGELVTADAEVIEAVTEHPEYGRLLWDAEAEKDNFLHKRTKDLALELRSNPDLMAAIRGEVFDLGEEPVKRGPGRPRKEAEA